MKCSNNQLIIVCPVNYLIVEALDSYHSFLEDKFQTEHPLGSGSRMNLKDVGTDLLKRVVSIFQANDNNARPCHGQLFRCSIIHLLLLLKLISAVTWF